MTGKPPAARPRRRAAASRILALICLAQTASCAGADRSGIRYVRHTGDMTSGCGDLSAGQAGLSIEDRPGEGVVTILNSNRTAFTFYYDSIGSFGDYQMFYLRFRDSFGNVIRLNGGSDCGWWSLKALESNLYEEGEWPPRKKLVIPAKGSLSIKRDFTDLLRWSVIFGTPIGGPCEVQFRLLGYFAKRSWMTVEADSQWQPGPCPSGQADQRPQPH